MDGTYDGIFSAFLGEAADPAEGQLDGLAVTDGVEGEDDDIYESFDVHETEMIHDIQETIESDEGLKIDNWMDMTVEQKGEVLQNLETRIASIESRQPMRVIVEDMDSHGYTNYADGIIGISTADVADNSLSGLREVVDTVVHEGRHEYQYRNVFYERTEGNDEKFQGWVDNFSTGYLRQEIFGWDAYRYQPIEADAWAFAAETVSNLTFR